MSHLESKNKAAAEVLRSHASGVNIRVRAHCTTLRVKSHESGFPMVLLVEISVSGEGSMLDAVQSARFTSDSTARGIAHFMSTASEKEIS